MTRPMPMVFVIDDDASVRKALARFLKAAGFRSQLFASAEEFLKQPAPDAPACALLDVSMPGLSGLDLQHALAERDVRLPVIFITGHGDIPMSVHAMKAGAADFLTKPFNAPDLLAAVHQAIARHAEALQAQAAETAVQQRAETLSQREREVMELVVRGLLNKQSGHKLGVSEKTIKAHRAQVMRKMQANSLPELVRMAEKIGIRAGSSF
jgi:FixJ family two-component response regulator